MFVGWLKKQLIVLKLRFTYMRKDSVKDQLYGGILEMTKNRELFYKTDIGSQHEYSHWTDEGKTELMIFMERYTKLMLVAEDAILREKAKQMTFDTLKAKQ